MNENERKIYHYLHDSASGVTIGKLQNEKLIFCLPSLFSLPGATVLGEYNFYFDPREKRALIFFDGHLPWGGLPKNSKVTMWGKTIISTPIQSVRKDRIEEETGPSGKNCPFLVDQEKKTMSLWIERYLLYLPKSRSVVRKYRADSLSPIYVMIEVNEKGVTWRNSS